MARTSTDPGVRSDCLEEGALLSLLDGRQLRNWEDHLGRCSSCRDRLQALAGGEIELQTPPAFHPSAALQHAITSLKATSFTSSTRLEEWLEPATGEHLLGQLGPYEVSHILAEGGMGVILEARDPLLHREVAIKLIKPQQVGNDLTRERMLREARVVAAIEHEAVVPIYAAEISEKTGAIFIVMPLVPGGNLQDRIDSRSSPFSSDVIISIASQIASGLAAVHSKGILHRDIKPANILMRENDRIWLADFGIARSDTDQRLTITGELPGTPRFMSPEQVNGHESDARSDLFSLGAVLYQLATGQPAFAEDNAIATARAVADRPHRPIASLNPDLPSWLSQLIDDLLEKSPSRRPQSTKEVIIRLTSRTASQSKIGQRIFAVLICITLAATTWFAFRPANPESSSPPITPATLAGNFTNSHAGKSYATLAEAISGASPGDAIEIHTEEPIDCESLPSIDKPIILRAAKGTEPTLTSNHLQKPLLHHTAPLILEGLRFRQRTQSASPPPVILAGANLSAAHCSFARDSQLLRAGGRPSSGIITADGAQRIEIINSALAAVASNAFTLTSQTQELHLKNTLIATTVGIYFRHSESDKVKVLIEGSSFHGKGLAAWDRSGGNQVAPVDFELTHSAIETTMGVFGLHVSSRQMVGVAVQFEGSQNLYSPGSPFLLLATSGSSEQITSLEDWQEFWPLGDKDSHLCEMDLQRRIRANRHRSNQDELDLRPSAKAAQKYPERGFDPEAAGLGEKYHRFRKTEGYREWIARATNEWPTFSEKK